MITTQKTVWCDAEGCPELVMESADTAADIRKIAKRRGWTRDGARDLCPKHSTHACAQEGCTTPAVTRVMYYDAAGHYDTRKWCAEHRSAAHGALRIVVQQIKRAR